MRHHFAPLGLFVSRFIFPRAMPWAFTFQAFGPGLSLYASKEYFLAKSVIMAKTWGNAPGFGQDNVSIVLTRRF